MQIRWSDEQEAIFDAGMRVDGHKVGDALAGTGKTTTLCEMIHRIVAALPGRRILVLSYMKRTRVELTQRLAGLPNVVVLSYNQLGFRYLRAWRRSIQFRREKGMECARAAVVASNLVKPGAKVPYEWTRRVRDLAALAKNALPETPDDLAKLARRQGLADRDYPVAWLVDATAKALQFACEDVEHCDYDDQVYLPVAWKLTPPFVFDDVIVDEGQDTSASQLWCATRTLAPGGRMIVVGDEHQACFSFRGADGQSMRRIIDALGARTYPLTVSRRCSRAVVAEAQTIVPAYQAAPDAIDGAVEHMGDGQPVVPPGGGDGERPDAIAIAADTAPSFASRTVVGDAVISRTNAPLVPVAFELIRIGLDACVLGRDPKGLYALIERSGAMTARSLVRWLLDYSDRECAALKEEGLNDAARELHDECHTIVCVARGASTIEDVRDRIGKIFLVADDPAVSLDGKIVCATAHRSKGLEFNNAFLLGFTFREGETEEDNLRYIGITRAKNKVTWIGRPQRETRAEAVEARAFGGGGVLDARGRTA